MVWNSEMLLHCWLGVYKVQLLCGIVWQFLSNFKMYITVLEVFSIEMITNMYKHIWFKNIHCSFCNPENLVKHLMYIIKGTNKFKICHYKNSCSDVKYSRQNTVDNTITTIAGVRGTPGSLA